MLTFIYDKEINHAEGLARARLVEHEAIKWMEWIISSIELGQRSVDRLRAHEFVTFDHDMYQQQSCNRGRNWLPTLVDGFDGLLCWITVRTLEKYWTLFNEFGNKYHRKKTRREKKRPEVLTFCFKEQSDEMNKKCKERHLELMNYANALVLVLFSQL